MGRYEEIRIPDLEGNVMKFPDHQNISAVRGRDAYLTEIGLAGDTRMEPCSVFLSTKVQPTKRHIGKSDGDVASFEIEKPSLNIF